jgi:hypothetical protein
LLLFSNKTHKVKGRLRCITQPLAYPLHHKVATRDVISCQFE